MRALLTVLLLTGLATTYAHNHIELVQRTHPLDGYNQGYIHIPGIPLPGWGADDLQPGLQWSCIGDTDFDLHVWLDATEAISSNEYTSLRYRFDKNNVSGIRDWEMRGRYRAYAGSELWPSREKIKFTKTAIDNKTTVLFEILAELKGAYLYVEFDLTGLKNKIEQLSCVGLTYD